jgi:hypothetical protein
MPRTEIEKFFHDVTHDPSLHRALLKRSRGPADFYPQAAKLARLLGYGFSADELQTWAEEEGGLPQAAPHSETAPIVAAPSLEPPSAQAGLTASSPVQARSPWSLRSWRLGEQR